MEKFLLVFLRKQSLPRLRIQTNKRISTNIWFRTQRNAQLSLEILTTTMLTYKKRSFSTSSIQMRFLISIGSSFISTMNLRLTQKMRKAITTTIQEVNQRSLMRVSKVQWMTLCWRKSFIENINSFCSHTRLSKTIRCSTRTLRSKTRCTSISTKENYCSSRQVQRKEKQQKVNQTSSSRL